MATKKSREDLSTNKILNRASSEVDGFAQLRQRFERNISILGRSKRTFDNYSRHVSCCEEKPQKTTSKGCPTPQKKQFF
ncbi:hypothetical protein [Chryseobacterium koreense]|uniref:Uncharacterized protein n=1 Tax=Chryseobacterium koreense CCUG 49689 TaxID=1304281 RepID=A0A0J7ILS9_9FLAO|nr:hypothetical protein [Chryseobacterium koreense]KMQ67011.1 hypothetical protein ACM44_14810 [Chryseobacterium koreense CCUG 49689]MBB5334670.1 hypothetical protein [Chryseobacterium koreense]